MNCDNVCKKISSFIDNELPEGERRLVEQHISVCAKCRKELDALMKNRMFIRNLKHVEKQKIFYSSLMARIESDGSDSVFSEGIADIFVRWFVPLPVICSVLLVLFLGFTALSPLVYAKTADLKTAVELTKSAFASVSGKNIVGPVNYIEYCDKCHMMLCESCGKGDKCECK